MPELQLMLEGTQTPFNGSIVECCRGGIRTAVGMMGLETEEPAVSKASSSPLSGQVTRPTNGRWYRPGFIRA
jgi:hypothetical protein